MATVETARLDELRATFTGTLLEPSDPGYEDARRVHNAMIDRRPALIAQCRNTADIVDTVHFARREGLEISVRGGGHNVAGRAVIDGAVMIDLSAIQSTDPLTYVQQDYTANRTRFT